MNIMTWFWVQKTGWRYDYRDVNKWAEMVRGNLTIPHTLSCVTDIPDGIDKGIKIIPIPKDFKDINTKRWAENKGRPQCYKRLALFSRHAKDIFGDRFVSMDMDCKVQKNLDSVFERDNDFIITKGTGDTRPYNGSMVMMNAGARPRVYDKFTPEMAQLASSKYIGSDQAWLAYCLGWCEDVWTKEDGVYLVRPLKYKTEGVPKDCKIAFFAGVNKEKIYGKQEKTDISSLERQPGDVLVEVISPIGYRGRREKGTVVAMPKEKAAEYGTCVKLITTG